VAQSAPGALSDGFTFPLRDSSHDGDNEAPGRAGVQKTPPPRSARPFRPH
jgi:hypothetical protein